MPISDAAPASERNLASEDAMIDDVRARYNEGQIDKKTLDAYEELYSASRNGFATVGTDDDVRAFEEAMVESSASQSS